MSVTFLLWLGGPHDGLRSAEPDLPLEVGDAVRCGCHDLLYEARSEDADGTWRVEIERDPIDLRPRLVNAER